MDAELKRDLIRCETDIDGAISRFADDEALYIACLGEFLKDPTMNDLEQTIQSRDWDEAFTAAHALKGLAGNMGFIPLFHATAEMVVLIRTGRLDEVPASYRELERCYYAITNTIHKHCPATAKGA